MAKCTYDFKHMLQTEKEREREREKERERDTHTEQNLAKQFTLHSAEVYSEPFPTSKQGGHLIGGNYFHKSIYLRCLKSFWIRCCLVNHETIKPHKKKTNHMTTLHQATQSLENLWNISYNGIK